MTTPATNDQKIIRTWRYLTKNKERRRFPSHLYIGVPPRSRGTGRATARSGRTATTRLTAPGPSPRRDYRLRSRVAAARPSSRQQKSGYCRQVSRRASAPRTRCRSLSPAARSQPMVPPSRLPASRGGRAASAAGGTWRGWGRCHGRHLVGDGGGGPCASRPAPLCARRSTPPYSYEAYRVETERVVWNVVYCWWGRLQAIFTLITALRCGASHEFPRCLNALVSTVVIAAREAPSYDTADEGRWATAHIQAPQQLLPGNHSERGFWAANMRKPPQPEAPAYFWVTLRSWCCLLYGVPQTPNRHTWAKDTWTSAVEKTSHVHKTTVKARNSLWKKNSHWEHESISRKWKLKIAFRHIPQMVVILCNTSLDLHIRWNAAVWLQNADLSQRAWHKPQAGLDFLKSACTVLFHASPHVFY